MADYPTITTTPNGTPVQAVAATEAVTWFAKQGSFCISTRSTAPDTAQHGIALTEGLGVEITLGKPVWYWGIGSGPVVIAREAL